ncbi:hypothetical protein [Vulcanococcus limneticus]|uniref:hypothetical protein n=1 Tax=Vulcanococcus limneticus TaxID=2170428 RepID=UPI000B9895A1|nr:hypothetical protein [Vulcanococcus limneticus]MCP9791502.1 hypothetical protein [Vulcanococcus limneticus MW73D5]MCP9896892.1 hypothetical protein [Vulcanococcus limneticus Candia 3B3]
MDEVLIRLETLERKLDRLLESSSPESDWVDSKEFCRLVGLADTKALVYQMSKGIPGGDAVRNIGTARRPRYRFHRTKAVNQFLNRWDSTSSRRRSN